MKSPFSENRIRLWVLLVGTRCYFHCSILVPQRGDFVPSLTDGPQSSMIEKAKKKADRNKAETGTNEQVVF